MIVPQRDDTRCAPQEQVDEAARKCIYRYEWDLSGSRAADGDVEVGELVCWILRLATPNGNRRFSHSGGEKTLIMESEYELALDIVALIGYHGKDVKEWLKLQLSNGIYDRVSPTH